VKAVRRASTLTDLLARTRPLMTRLHRWRDALPPVLNQSIAQVVDDEPSQCGPLRLCYLSMILLIFRALLRPLAYDPQASEENRCEPRSTIFVNSQSYAKWGIESIAALKAKHFVNFWPACKFCQILCLHTSVLLTIVFSSRIQRRAVPTVVHNKFHSLDIHPIADLGNGIRKQGLDRHLAEYRSPAVPSMASTEAGSHETRRHPVEGTPEDRHLGGIG
jgi:hypothetical protein